MSGATSEEGNDEAPQVQPQPPPPAATTSASPGWPGPRPGSKEGAHPMSTDGNGDDRISTLPDDILVNILDRLYVRDAARTGATYTENLRFAESDFVSNIIVTCKQLKYLGFLNCDTASFTTLQLEHAELSELLIVNCNFDKVELKWLPRLTQTTFGCWMLFDEPPLSFGHVPLLEVLRLTNIARSWHKMVKLSTLLFQTSVRDLWLGFKCEKIWVQPECLTKGLAHVFHRLKIVNLVNIPEGYDLTWTMFIVEAAPSLEEVYMTVIDHPCEMQTDKEKKRAYFYSENKGVEWESSTSNFKHHRLTKLIIFCFESEVYMVSLVRCVLKAAVNLKDVPMEKPTRFPQTEKQRCSAKNLLTEGIESKRALIIMQGYRSVFRQSM